MTEIKAYVELFEIGDIEMFVACVRALDTEFLKRHREKRDAENAAKK